MRPPASSPRLPLLLPALLGGLLAALLPGRAAGAEPQARPRLVVLSLQAAGGLEPALAESFTESVTAEVAGRGLFEVLGQGDVKTLVGLERQRQLLGCTTERDSSCLTELLGALDARFVLSGSLTRLGGVYQLNLQALDTVRAAPVGRSTRMAAELSTLRAQLAYSVAEATGTPLPPPPSRVLPYTLMAAGGVGLVAGSIVGVQALAQEGAIRRELESGRTQPSVLKPMDVYRRELAGVELQRTASLLSLVAGAGLLAGGFLLQPSDPLEGLRGGTGLGLVVGAGGVGVAGRWP
jgi:TolB-like protein